MNIHEKSNWFNEKRIICLLIFFKGVQTLMAQMINDPRIRSYPSNTCTYIPTVSMGGAPGMKSSGMSGQNSQYGGMAMAPTMNMMPNSGGYSAPPLVQINPYGMVGCFYCNLYMKRKISNLALNSIATYRGRAAIPLTGTFQSIVPSAI